ncbi:MAG: hypothetical protein F6K36_19515 [Symploca sp. SIO3C6]|uniref:Thylakoid lumen protein n=1 Tax=Symploca sp. SIO1C4 TaxID=2607765 RepID=A0A6B3N8M9_9CYAN|nr:hypothetical protein [Symploca sp. SIO3C6]NER27987.1 hypothetical protein [Symploca sp. SIO1C4]NET03346.1 hypothetical protein [Symploca sp. SIO2B6]
MSNSVINSFFLGRAVAIGLNEILEESLTNALSELGKFDAEQRERLRHFVEQVQERASREAEAAVGTPSGSVMVSVNSAPVDLQATIDELRSEIARLRAELQTYRHQNQSV